MASSVYSHQPKVYSNIKDFSNYDYCDESSGSSDDDVEYENGIEYSLQQQDKIEKILSDSNKLKSLSKSQLQPIIKSNSKSNLNKSTLKYNTSNNNLLNNIKPIFIDLEDEQQEKEIKILNNNNNNNSNNNNNNNNNNNSNNSNSNGNNNNNNNCNSNSNNSNGDYNKNGKNKENYQTSESVYNIIKSDSSLAGKIHEFIICYEDRLGMAEVPFNSFDNVNIPLYRIQIFKYKDQIIWNRKERVYNILI